MVQLHELISFLVSNYFSFFFFFFNDTATTDIYTLSLHDALPIYVHDVPVIFIVDSQVGKKIASTHLLLDHILIPPKTLLKVESISAVSDASGREVSVVCLSQGQPVEAVKNIYSGALMPNGAAH